MSDTPNFSPDVPFPRRSGSNHWSLKKIVEDVTGKRLEDMQERPARKDSQRIPTTPPLPSFLPQEKRPLFTTLPPEMLENVPFINEQNPSPKRKSSRKDLERKYLAYLMMHMDSLTDPALRYLRQAVEDECKDRDLP